MRAYRWTRRRTWPDDNSLGADQHWTIYRDGVRVGVVSPAPEHPTRTWRWTTATDPWSQGMADNLEEALEALRQAAGDLPPLEK